MTEPQRRAVKALAAWYRASTSTDGRVELPGRYRPGPRAVLWHEGAEVTHEDLAALVELAAELERRGL